jgi:hypothetical protein
LCAIPCSGVKEITLDIISRKIDCVCTRSRTLDLLYIVIKKFGTQRINR